MKKEVKIALYCLLILAITIVAILMIGSPKQIDIKTGLEVDTPKGSITSEITPEPALEPTIEEATPSFEDDVMNDLESFFGNSNGYENVEGDYGFNNEQWN